MTSLNLLTFLESHASKTPNKIALGFFDQLHNGAVPKTLSYQDFVHKAYAVANTLLGRGLRSEDRVLIVLPQSIDYLIAFYGCLYAGLIPVTLYPPKGPSHVQRLTAVIADAEARAVITDSAISIIFDQSHYTLQQRELLVVNITEIGTAAIQNQFSIPTIDSSMTAYLQYTSGSTGQPKGVCVRHSNLIANLRMQQKSYGISNDTTLVSWLPLCHDMGLIGVPILALHFGASAYITTPTNFIRHPKIWLEAITYFKGTMSWAPNFAYDLCVNGISEKDRQNLDLSSWQVAVNASEPVRAQTIDAFINSYKQYGFSARTMKPGFGLAEATLQVTVTDLTDTFYVESIDRDQIQSKKMAILATHEASNHLSYVSCGRKSQGTSVLIVDPENTQELAVRHVGEIWVKGPHVCSGYWQKSDESTRTMGAFTQHGTGPCLRTGDLGYLNENGDLFIVGRLKDIVIVRGRNYAASDIEQTIEAASPKIRAGFVAAFSVENEEKEDIVILIEMRDPLTHEEGTHIVTEAQRLCRVEHGIVIEKIIFVSRGTLAKTTSGKHQRQMYKRHYLDHSLSLFHFQDRN